MILHISRAMIILKFSPTIKKGWVHGGINREIRKS
jgi:hypothetical protein